MALFYRQIKEKVSLKEILQSTSQNIFFVYKDVELSIIKWMKKQLNIENNQFKKI